MAKRPSRATRSAHPLEQPTAGDAGQPAEAPLDGGGEQVPAAAPVTSANLALAVDCSKLTPEQMAFMQQMVAAGAMTTAPAPAAYGDPTQLTSVSQLPAPLPTIKQPDGTIVCKTRAFALRALELENIAIPARKRLFCCLPTIPPELWHFNPEEWRVTNGEGQGQILNYPEGLRDEILRAFGEHLDPLRRNDEGPKVPLPSLTGGD